MSECAKCGDSKPMHAKCESCGQQVCASCFEGFSMKYPGCGEERMELV